MYSIEIHSPDGAPPPPLAVRSSHEAYRAILTRLAPRCGIRVRHDEHGDFRLWLSNGQARVAIDGSHATDPQGAAEDATVEFVDEAGAAHSVPSGQTVSRDRALVALADWLDGGQRTELLAWS